MYNNPMTHNLYSLILVATQLVSVGYIFLITPRLPDNPLFVILLLFGFLYAAWAVWLMNRRSILNITPDVRSKTRLITTGPYRYIRHPMYFGLICMSAALVFGLFSWGKLIAFLFLLVALFFKVLYEEKLLIDHFKEYKTYMDRTWALVPFVF
jgi:protein-S-isoprenylcysteine O-methyltransferase Ste14